MAKIIIDYDKCDACGECADLCPMEILIIVDDKLEVQNQKTAMNVRCAWMYAQTKP